MTVFSSNSSTVEAWGPTASVTVTVPGFTDVVNDSWLLTGFNVNAREITDIRQCFNDMSYVYALGNDQQVCTITLEFVIFIGRKECGDDDNTKSIGMGMADYAKNRISAKGMQSPKTITIGSFSRSGWLSNINIGRLDPSTSVCYGTLTFIMELGGSTEGK